MRVAAINGGSPVADGDYGDLSFANDGWLWAAFDGTAALDAGTRVGTVSGSWLLAEDQSGFVAVGGSGAIDDTDSNYRILVYREICW
jgi:hypothetical protein